MPDEKRGQTVKAFVSMRPVTGKILRRELRGWSGGVAARLAGKGSGMTPPQPGPRSGTPQPRDIALELGTPEQAADLEGQSSTAAPALDPGHEPTPESSEGS